jgi:hypothetical protein
LIRGFDRQYFFDIREYRFQESAKFVRGVDEGEESGNQHYLAGAEVVCWGVDLGCGVPPDAVLLEVVDGLIPDAFKEIFFCVVICSADVGTCSFLTFGSSGFLSFDEIRPAVK